MNFASLPKFYLNKWFFSYEVYTDGGYKAGRGSWAYVLLRRGKVVREDSGMVRKTSSNSMEFQAAIEALKSLPPGSHVTLYTDSRILIGAVTRQTKEWKAFLPQVKALDAFSELHSISWKWVRAHAGNRHNERCDELCVRARSRDPI